MSYKEQLLHWTQWFKIYCRGPTGPAELEKYMV